VLDAIAEHRALAGSHLVPSVRGDLLMRAGRHDDAVAAFTEAASLTDNAAERALLTDRAARADSDR
jgi:predicted RNA polymerase sigma factor